MIVSFFQELETVFGWLWQTSWQASILVVLVLFLQWVLGARLNPRWRYTLWLLVLIRLILPALPTSAFSVFQFAPQAPIAFTEPVMRPLFPLTTSPSAPKAPSAPVVTVAAEKPLTLSLYSCLALGWLSGVLILAALTMHWNWRFLRQIHHSPEVNDPELRDLLVQAKAELNLQGGVRLIESAEVQGPAVMGLFRPVLLLPANARQKFDLAEMRLVFLHELAHLKRGDLVVQLLIAWLQILHWFNPVLWFAFRRMRADREPATDALVLSRAGENEKERYGLMLIKLLEHFNQRAMLPTLVGILEDKEQFKRRFSLIGRFTRGAYGWSLLGIVLIGALAAIGLTKASPVPAQARPPVPGAAGAPPEIAPDGHVIYRQARAANEASGWGDDRPKGEPAPTWPPEQFEIVPRNGQEPRTFSGKVIVHGPMKGVEIGLVSFVGLHWVNPQAYQWKPVAEDGSFSITEDRYPNEKKTIVVRGPDTPWTFLRRDFSSSEAAKNIVLKADPPCHVHLTVTGVDGKKLSPLIVMPFPYGRTDDQGRQLVRQCLDKYFTEKKDYIDLVLPPERIALFVGSPGYAYFYQVIDPRRDSNVEFMPVQAGKIKIRVLDAKGNLKKNCHGSGSNAEAPLSGVNLDLPDGESLIPDMAPGTFKAQIDGFPEQSVEVKSGQVSEMIFQAGPDGAFSAEEILLKSKITYRALQSYSDHGAVMTQAGLLSQSADFKIRLQRPDFYRVEWQGPSRDPYAVWSDGTGYFLQGKFLTGGSSEKQSSHERTLGKATGISHGITATLPGIFFGDDWSNVLGHGTYQRQKDESVGNVVCYVVSSVLQEERMITGTTLWIGQKDNLIHKVSTLMEKFSEMPPAGPSKSSTTLSATQGVLKALFDTPVVSFTELHQDIVTNKSFAPADFKPEN